MCQTIQIRPAAPGDIDRVTTMLGRSYRALLAPDYHPAVLHEALPLLAQARPSLMNCGTYFLAVEEDGRVVAAGGWTDFSPHGRPGRRGEGHVRHVAVDPDQARRGLGRALMRRVLSSAEAAGVTLLRCKSTLTAVPFYRDLGFVPTGRIEVRLSPGVYFPAVQMRRGAAS